MRYQSMKGQVQRVKHRNNWDCFVLELEVVQFDR